MSDKNDKEFNKLMTKIIQAFDFKSVKFGHDAKKEMDWFQTKNTWKFIISGSTGFKDVAILGGKYAWAIENFGTENEEWKARFEGHEYKDGIKTSFVPNFFSLANISFD